MSRIKQATYYITLLTTFTRELAVKLIGRFQMTKDRLEFFENAFKIRAHSDGFGLID